VNDNKDVFGGPRLITEGFLIFYLCSEDVGPISAINLRGVRSLEEQGKRFGQIGSGFLNCRALAGNIELSA